MRGTDPAIYVYAATSPENAVHLCSHTRRPLLRAVRCVDSTMIMDSSGRRHFLRGAITAGLSAAMMGGIAVAGRAFAQARPAERPPLVDVHHHIIPPFYLAENRDRIIGVRGAALSRPWLEWTPQQSLAAMDEHGVATAVVSLTMPGVWFGDAEAARSTARRFNEYAADLARSHPGRFGLFATIPLPDRDGSLREIEYAFEVLKADGIGLLTNYDDKWLGDPAYQHVLEELNRRKAVVFVHPVAPHCCRTLLPGIQAPMVEVPQDTTRTIISLLFSGTLARYRNIRFIFSHAGGTLPVLARRISDFAPRDMAEKVPNGVEYELRRLFYDIAVSGYRPAIAALTGLVPMTQILFGSDHPFRPLAETAETMPGLGLSAADLKAIGRDNALALLPGLQRS